MTYAVVINLNYTSFPEEQCSVMWDVVKESMLGVGFRMDGRRFTINAPELEATTLARKAINSIGEHQEFENKRIYRFINEFYGFEVENVSNLLMPTDASSSEDDSDIANEASNVTNIMDLEDLADAEGIPELTDIVTFKKYQQR